MNHRSLAVFVFGLFLMPLIGRGEGSPLAVEHLDKNQYQIFNDKRVESGSAADQRSEASKHQPEALLLAVESAAAINDVSSIDSAIATLLKESPHSTITAEAFLLKAKYLNNVMGDKQSGQNILQHIKKAWPDTEAAAIATILLNDYVVHSRFKQVIDANQDVLLQFPDLPIEYKSLANFQMGIYSYQINEIEAAKDYLGRTIAEKNLWSEKAKLYLKAIENPTSAEGLIALFEKGERYKNGRTTRNICWKVFREFDAKSKASFFDQYCNDPLVPAHDRAEMLYRLILVKWELGNHDDILTLCQQILKLVEPDSLIGQKAQYAEAYHHSHCGHFSMAASIFRKLLKESIFYDEVTPAVFRELAYCLELEEQFLDAALLLNEYNRRYPHRHEVSDFNSQIKRFLLRGGVEVAAEYKRKTAAKTVTDGALTVEKSFEFRSKCENIEMAGE